VSTGATVFVPLDARKVVCHNDRCAPTDIIFRYMDGIGIVRIMTVFTPGQVRIFPDSQLCASFYSHRMDNNRQEHTPLRACDLCKAPMVFVSVLPAIGLFPRQRVYKCSFCKLAVADIASD
jgi:hypothetical protein